MRGATLFCLALSVLALRPAAAVVIDPSQSAGSVPGVAGSGLSGSYYKFAPSVTYVVSLSQANQLMAADGGPTATFSTNTVCFPDCSGDTVSDSSSLNTLLNGNVSNFSYTVPGTTVTSLNYAAMVVTGYIAITQAGSYTFHLGSDDGSELVIGGQAVVMDDDVHSFTTDTGSASFAAAGLYAISIEYFENSGVTGLDLWASQDSTGQCFIGRNANCGGMASTSAFYTSASAPEPGTLGLFAIGLLALGFAGRFLRVAV